MPMAFSTVRSLTVVGSKLYALFYVNKGSGYATYYDSVVVRFAINARLGHLTYDNAYVTAGKNSFTLDLYDNKLYVCSLAECRMLAAAMPIPICAFVDLANFTQGGVTKVTLANLLKKVTSEIFLFWMLIMFIFSQVIMTAALLNW